MAHISLDVVSKTGQQNSWEDVARNDRDIQTAINGGLDNTNLSSTAAISHSKLASAPSGRVLLGNASNVVTATALSGDATVSSGGVVTVSNINNAAITNAKLKSVTDADIDATPQVQPDTNRPVGADNIRRNSINKSKVSDDAIGSNELDLYVNSDKWTTGTSYDSITSTTDSGPTTVSIADVPAGTYVVSVSARGWIKLTGVDAMTALYLGVKATSGVSEFSATYGPTSDGKQNIAEGFLGPHAWSELPTSKLWTLSYTLTTTKTSTVSMVNYYTNSSGTSGVVVYNPQLTIYGVKA
jgi:hypothetical protein